jgi:hypothetical protein
MTLKGFISIDELYLVEVDADPTVSSVTAPLSSLAIMNNGGVSSGLWVKTGTADTAWTPVTPTTIKAGTVTAVTFSGNPKKAAVTFGTAFPTTSYAISIKGVDNRGWTYESKATTGFTINSNANAALTGEVSWQAESNGG